MKFRMSARPFFLSSLFCALLLSGVDSYAQQVIEETKHDVSAPLRDNSQGQSQRGPAHEMRKHPEMPNPAGPGKQDPVIQSSPVPPAALTLTGAPTPGVAFDGIGQGFTGPAGTFTVNSAPPDPNGAVGPNHYVETVNTDFAIFTKAGTPIYGPVPIFTLWAGFGGGCQVNNDGDPTVIYDKLADRWIIQQFSVTTTPYLLCVAVSTTSDPTGSYNRYSFNYTNFPDYPKLAAWPDAYYVTTNDFANGSTFAGARVCAMDRSKMIAGTAATLICFTTSTAYGGLLPSDLDGKTPPPAGSPNYMLALDTTSTLVSWKFHVDFTSPANSTFIGPTSIPVAGYTATCNGGTCIPQGGTSQQLDSLADRLMYRLAYRNLGNHESLVVNHSVVAGSSSGVRWYELRIAGGTPTLFQQGTYAPDANWRWMGSAAMDQSGNIGVGYSVSGSSIFPQVHFTGRLAGDAAGVMTQGENVIIDGTGSQTANLSRWGDYSSMSIDPVDDCTFWYTGEYLKSSGTFNWSTRIGSFKLPGCGTTPTPDYALTATPSSQTVTQGQNTSYTVTVTPSGSFTGAVSFSVAGLPSGATASFTPASVTSSGTSTLAVTTTTSAPAGTYPLTITGASGSLSHTTSVTLVVNAAAVPSYTLSASPSSQTIPQGQSTPYSVTVTPSGGFAGTVTFSVTGLPTGTTGSFTPASVAGAGSSTLTVATSTTTPAGTYALTITGTSGSLTRTTGVTLVVTASVTGNFTLSASPTYQSVHVGVPAIYTVTLNRTGGFSGSVTLSATGLPSGATAAFSPNPVTGASSTLTVQSSSSSPRGNFNITITGVSGSLQHTTLVTLRLRH